MPQGQQQGGESSWDTSQPSRRPEAAYEETGQMAAHQDGPPRRREPVQRQDTAVHQRESAVHRQETMIAQPPRRSRGRGGAEGPPQPPTGPPGGGGKGDKPKWRRFLPSWKLVVVGFVVLTAGVFAMVMVGYANTAMPNQQQVQDSVDDQGSIIRYSDKKILAHLGTKRIPVDIKDVPVHVQDAVIAAENSGFRDDAGISFTGMLRSLYSTVSGQQVQGASTITQQMARNYYDGLSQERSVQRKIKEIYVAIKLNKELSKDTILIQYLNTIYFGRGANGIGAAASAFFGKKVNELTPEQGAYLAGRIQNPDAFDQAEQAGKPAATQERYEYVLKQMAQLNQKDYGQLLAKSPTAPKLRKKWDKDYYKGIEGYMIEAVVNEFKAKTGLSEEEIKTGGYDITSTFDRKLMYAAKAAVNQHTRGLTGEINATLATVDPRNGRVIAFYGGDDYAKDAWNDAFLSQKQAASAFKPYVLAAWLHEGYSLRSFLPAKGPLKLENTTPIDNDHATSASAIDVVAATKDSINTAYAKMGEKVGLDSVIDIATRAGLNKKRLLDAREEHNYLITIGSNPVTVVEQAGGYSIFANKGKHFENHVIIEAKKRQNKKDIVLPETKKVVNVISEEAAADASAALEAVVKQGTGRNAALYNRPVAGKTGTNNGNKEAWFVGYTPQLSTAVGMFRQECRTKSGKVVPPRNDTCPWYRGKDSSKEKKYTPQKPYTTPFEVGLGAGFQGATYPAAIWKTFMTEATKNMPVEQFPARVDGGVPENLAPKPEPKPAKTEQPEDDGTDPDSGCNPFEADCDEGDANDLDTAADPGDTSNMGEDMMGGGSDGRTVPDPMPGRREDG
ncbi:transglycosylase domain-containing protein [Nonomuraea longicatena]|uniref:Transglycosylase domain-containing protein n=1 Tax=Nonomuraea longicatena TaxID=83682 RepID=A0ABP3ZB32_9ACTN